MEKATIVLFGASGDLARQKLYPALFHLFDEHRSMRFIGFARSEMTTASFRNAVRTAVLAQDEGANREMLEHFVSAWTYVCGSYDKRGLAQLVCFPELKEDVDRFFYLSIPSDEGLIAELAKGLHAHRLVTDRSHIVLEKPFGFNAASARRLNAIVSRFFPEERIFRIDHYLAKDLVQDLLALRFANPIFEPVWNAKYIERISIAIRETEGIRQRGQYYDRSGAIRDMIQNHALQLLALTVMKQPKDISAASIHREKIAVFRKIRLWENSTESVHIGQYAGYRDEPYVAPESLTETFVQLTVFVDIPKWRGVPIELLSGKKLEKKSTDITIHFKKRPHGMWEESGCFLHANTIAINVAPENDIRLTLNSDFDMRKKCAFPTELRFGFQNNRFLLKEPYENALRDLFAKDQSLFVNAKEIDLAWQFTDDILANMNPQRAEKLKEY